MSICERCSTEGKDCCHLRGDPAYKFGLTLADMRRISKATGLRPEEFADLERMPKFPMKEMMKVSPNLERMFPHQTRVALKFEGEDGACYFWEKGKGCSLTVDQRPRFCAIYPAWYRRYGSGDEDFVIDTRALAGGDRCMAVDEGRTNPKRVLKVIGQTKAQLLHLIKASDKELDQHAEASVDEVEGTYKGQTE